MPLKYVGAGGKLKLACYEVKSYCNQKCLYCHRLLPYPHLLNKAEQNSLV